MEFKFSFQKDRESTEYFLEILCFQTHKFCDIYASKKNGFYRPSPNGRLWNTSVIFHCLILALYQNYS